MAKREFHLFKQAQQGFPEVDNQAAAPGGAVQQVGADIAAQQAQQGVGPAQMIPTTQQPWIGPRVSVFQNTSTNVPTDPVKLQDFILNELYRKHPYLSRYPAELGDWIRDEDQDKIGEVMLANEMGSKVSIPFVVKEGKLKPFVVAAIDGEMYALGDEQDFIELMESPMPAGSTGKPMPGAGPGAQGTPKTDLMLSGPESASNGDRRSTLDALVKQSSLVQAFIEAGVSRQIADMLDVKPDVVQYERVPFGCIQKVASADCFEPMQRHFSLDELPDSADIVDAFHPNSYVTEHLKVAADDDNKGKYGEKISTVAIGKEKEEKKDEGKKDGGAKTVTYPIEIWDLIDYDKQRKRRKAQSKKRKGLPPFGITYIDTKRVGRQYAVYPAYPEHSFHSCANTVEDVYGAPTTISDRESWIAFSSDGSYAWIREYSRLMGMPLKKVPKLGMDISKAFASGKGTEGFILCNMPTRDEGDDIQAVGPIDFVKSDRAMFLGDLHDVVVSSEVKYIGRQRGPMSNTLYIPKGAKFVPAQKEVVIKEYDPTEVVGDVVQIRKEAANSVSLHGSPVANGVWDGDPVAESVLSFKDAVFVLGALGVDEDYAHQKLADAVTSDDGREQIEVFDSLQSPEPMDVNIGFMKFAAALPAQSDRFMAIQLLGSKTIDTILEKLPAVKEFADDIAVTTLAAQAGLGDVEETVSYQALRNLQELIHQLEQLKVERGMPQTATV